MEDKVLNGNKEELEIDLTRLFMEIWHRIWAVILVAVAGFAIAIAGTYFFITPQYQSSVMFYVNNSAISVGDASLSISSGDIVASKSLVDSYIVILNSRESLNDVIDYSGLDCSYSELKEMVSASSVNDTEIFQVVVTNPDPAEAEKIANAIAHILPKRISCIVEGTSAKVVDYAVIPSMPSSPSYAKNAILGAMLGIIFSVGVIVIKTIFDTTIHTEEDITQSCKYPILAAVPNMSASSKGGYYVSSDKKRKKKRKKHLLKQDKAEQNLVGNHISFAASEAYKLLRTKVQFSFADESDCHVIGVSSALAGEGKSLSSINLVYSLAQLNKKVLLIDCDMRRPSVHQKIAVKSAPGLSNYLTRQVGISEVVQQYRQDDAVFHVIAAGTNPPNPIELLSSSRMKKAVDALREIYDYIIFDLPPVEEVSDAMVAAKLADGILLVVRQDYCDRSALTSAVRQFAFVDARVLGLVFNSTTDTGGGYGKKYGKYKKYYRKYRHNSYQYGGYRDSDVAAAQRSKGSDS